MVVWRPFEIHPEVPAAGMPLSALGYDSEDLAAAMAKLSRLAAAAGIVFAPCSPASLLANTHRALVACAIVQATDPGRLEAFHPALFPASFGTSGRPRSSVPSPRRRDLTPDGSKPPWRPATARQRCARRQGGSPKKPHGSSGVRLQWPGCCHRGAPHRSAAAGGGKSLWRLREGRCLTTGLQGWCTRVTGDPRQGKLLLPSGPALFFGFAEGGE